MNAQEIIDQLERIEEALEEKHAFDIDDIDTIEDLLDSISVLLY